MTNPFLSPEEARAALGEVSRHRHSAVDAAYDTPQWYFLGLGGMLVALSGLYFSNTWVEERLGFVAAVVAFILGIALFGACLALLVGLTVKRQRAMPSSGGFSSRRDIVVLTIAGLALYGAIFGISFGVTDDGKDAVALSLVILAVVIAAGGRPLQTLMRRRAHRRLDEQDAR